MNAKERAAALTKTLVKVYLIALLEFQVRIF